MKYHSEHNKWLNKQPEETMEQYNKRISDWGHKQGEREWLRITAYEEMLNIIRGEMEHERARWKNIEGYKERTKGYFMLALEYMEKMAEDMIENHRAIAEYPTEYEIKWGGKDNYKLSKRS